MGRYLGRMRTTKLISNIKNLFRTILGPILPAMRIARNIPAHIRAKRIAKKFKPNKSLSVFYLTLNFPNRPASRSEIAHGGAVKLIFLAEAFPHSYPHASLLYTVSSVDHVAKKTILQNAKKNGLKIVLNQNGVAYPAWYGSGWESPNKKMKESYDIADFIIFQSEFCKLGAERYLGPCSIPNQIIYNPVDLNLYFPEKNQTQRKSPILLLGGNQFSKYRFEIAARVLSKLIQHLPDSRLIVTGKLWNEERSTALNEANLILNKLGIADQVEFTGQYSQQDGINIFRRADILIHTQYNDASPTLVGEAMACGLPIVYSESGGTPELVGPNAGIGIHVEKSWDKIFTPDPEKMAEAVQIVWDDQVLYKEAARNSAEEKFPLNKYIQAHYTIFEHLLEH